jgi:hypothetical protein
VLSTISAIDGSREKARADKILGGLQFGLLHQRPFAVIFDHLSYG